MIGILMLDTAFPRFLGDVGNPRSFDYPVTYAVVPGATPEAIVCGDIAPWIDAFIAAGQRLVAEGCTGLTTTCGFLTPVRARVAKETGVPVVASALELVANLLSEGRRPGILTISAQSLSKQHLAAASIPHGTPVQGVDGSHFAKSILGNTSFLRRDRSEKDLVAGALTLIERHPSTDVIVLECTNMPPHKTAIEDATGREVVSILTAINRLRQGCLLAP